MERAQLNFANKQPPKKKRKSRTAFTNHQVNISFMMRRMLKKVETFNNHPVNI